MSYRTSRLRAPLAFVLILATVAGALAPTANSLSPSTAEAAANVLVALYSDADFQGPITVLTTSQPDLSQLDDGWANRASAIMILGGISVAAYSGPNYTGTCEPFIGEDPWLGNNRIGNDNIESIKLYATCTDENVWDPVVTEITAVAGESEQTFCPSGYVQKNQDLNEGVGGDYVYLCLRIAQRIGDGPPAEYVRRVEVVTSLTPKTSDGRCFDASNPGTDAHFVDVDLNSGAGGTYIYLCYWTANQTWVDNGLTSATGVMRDFAFAVDSNLFLPFDDIMARCRQGFPDFRAGNVEESSIQIVNGNGPNNLNDLVDPILGPHIWMCALTYTGALSTPPDTTPPTITFTGQTPPPNQYGWNNSEVTLTWSCADNESGPAAPSVSQTVSTEGFDQSVTGTCMDQAANPASDTQSGINIDLTAPNVWLSGHPTSYLQGEQVVILCTASDSLSGILTDCQGIDQPANDFGVGSHSVPFTATDYAGNVGTNHAIFDVLNVAPAITTTEAGPAPSLEGESVSVRAEFTDPGTNDTHTCTLTWGDGESEPGTVVQTQTPGVKECAGAHTYNDNGNYTVGVEVCDEHGGCDQDEVSHIVENVAPTITALGSTPDPSTETESVTLEATFSDPGTLDSFTCAIDWGDGSDVETGLVTGTTCLGTHVYVDDNPSNTAQDDYTIQVEICDDDNGCSQTDTLQTVTNLPPVIDQISGQAGSYGQPVTINVSAHDPSSEDSLSYAFDCDDDGTFEIEPQADASVTCTPASGTLSPQIRVRVNDDDLGADEDTLTLALSGRTFCIMRYTGELRLGDTGCGPTMQPVVVQTGAPTTFCVWRYTGQLSLFRYGCPEGWLSYTVPDVTPLPICVNRYTGTLRHLSHGTCTPTEVPDVVPAR